jgi:predicted dienelactone hydrolase
MDYAPWGRGPHPVGVRSLDATDRARDDRPLPIELWYPAAERHAGEDVSPATRDAYELVRGLPPLPQDAVRDAEPAAGRFPLVAFSHGYGGHRRQSTFLATHLASHGYVVAAVDHTGNTMREVLHAMLAAQKGAPPPDVVATLTEFSAARPLDLDFLIHRVRDAASCDLAERIDGSRVGAAGHSFGGWTALTVTARNRDVRAVVALAPAGGLGALGGEHLREALELGWGRDVPALLLVADRDSLLPLESMRDIAARITGPRRLVVLENADHLHFCDRIEEVHELFRAMPPPGAFARLAQSILPIAELCAPDRAYAFVRGLALAHFDAALKADAGAAAFLEHRLAGALAEQGIAATVAAP